MRVYSSTYVNCW